MPALLIEAPAALVKGRLTGIVSRGGASWPRGWLVSPQAEPLFNALSIDIIEIFKRLRLQFFAG